MGKTTPPNKILLLCGLICSSDDIYNQALAALIEQIGPVGIDTITFPFDHTDYYTAEMGSGLTRRFIAFDELMNPDRLAGVKLMTNEIEARLSDNRDCRRINIDPGYLSLNNLVLASTKNFAHRLYLKDGIYGEITLIYQNGAFTTLPWTYPDYRDIRALGYFTQLRQNLKIKIKK